MTTATPLSSRAGAALLVAAAAVIALAPRAAGSAALEAPPAGSSSTMPAPASPSAPTPTTHSYDDADIEQGSEGSSPALWILAGALTGLAAVGAILLRAGKSPRDHRG